MVSSLPGQSRGTTVAAMNPSRALAGVVVLVGLALAACGGGDDASTTGSAPATAPAPAGLEIGIGEQGLKMFADPDFKALGITKARLVTSYDTTRVGFERDIVEQWLAGARAAGAEPFI